MIGSANILLKDAAFRDSLNSDHGIIAYEMQGAGVAIAAATFNLGYLNVRGICDYGDNEKNDDWQRYAGVCAASFARVVLEEG
jgi:nucleoside phosphorylase